MKTFTLLFYLVTVPVAAWSDSLSLHHDHPDIRIERITTYTPELTRMTADFSTGDMVVFDLDNTVFREAQHLGTDEWFAYILHEMMATGLSRNEAMQELGPLNGAIKYKSKMKLMEPEVVEFIHALQSRGVVTIGLTARHSSYVKTTLRQLRDFDIDFSRSPVKAKIQRDFVISGNPSQFVYQDGVMFVGGAKKGFVLKNLLLQTGYIPRRLAAIDDRIDHIESYVEATQDLGVKSLLIHYLRVLEEPPFEPEVARIQLQVFKKLGLILSDDEARTLFENNVSPIKLDQNWSCSKLLISD